MPRGKKEEEGELPRWEWRLPGGERVSATLDTETGTEAVFVDGNLVSKGARGAKPEGHVVSLKRASSEAATEPPVVVAFDPRLVICLLRIGREEVTPDQWPRPRRGKALGSPRRSFPLGIIAAVLLAAGVALGGAALAMHLRASSREAALTGVHRAENGLFVAHFPGSFQTRPAVLPPGFSGLVLEDRKNEEAIVIVALASEDGLHDPWALQKRAHGEALANVPHGGGAHVETARSDATCLGQPGAVVIGRVTGTSGAPAAVWSCALFHGSDGYVVMYALSESASAAAAVRLRRVVEATELTRLGSMTASPQ